MLGGLTDEMGFLLAQCCMARLAPFFVLFNEGFEGRNRSLFRVFACEWAHSTPSNKANTPANPVKKAVWTTRYYNIGSTAACCRLLVLLLLKLGMDAEVARCGRDSIPCERSPECLPFVLQCGTGASAPSWLLDTRRVARRVKMLPDDEI